MRERARCVGISELKSRLERESILYHLDRFDGDTRKLSEFLKIRRKHFCRCRKLGIQLRDL